MGGRDLVLADELAHNSIISGCKAAKCTFLTYPHNDLDALERLLEEKRAEFGRVLIATDGLFSMDGDVTDLPKLLDIKDRHDAWLLLDEAHSYGVLGEPGVAFPSILALIRDGLKLRLARCPKVLALRAALLPPMRPSSNG